VRTDERILTAAMKLFRKRGFHRVAVADIGTAVGISGPAVYKHFAGKDEILSVLFLRAMERLEARTDLEDPDPWARLDAMVDTLVGWTLVERDLVLIYLREDRSLGAPVQRSLRRHVEAHMRRWSAVIAACRPDLPAADVETLAWAFNEMLMSIATWARGPRSNPGLRELMQSTIRDGVRGAGGRQLLGHRAARAAPVVRDRAGRA
jgi:AcrR family transcriptional regulator